MKSKRIEVSPEVPKVNAEGYCHSAGPQDVNI